MKRQPILYADLLDMRYEGHEKAYGAYPLRKHQPWYLFTAFAVVGGLFLVTAFAVERWGGTNKENSPLQIVDLCLCLYDFDTYKIQEIGELIPEKIEPEALGFRTPQPADRVRVEGPKVIPLPPQAGNVLLDWSKAIEADTLEEEEGFDTCLCMIPDEGDGDRADCMCIYEEDNPSGPLVFEPPLPINLEEVRAAIPYPEWAAHERIEGKVTFRVLIDKQGNYRRHKVLHYDHPSLLEGCDPHIQRLKFTPAVASGKPIVTWMEVPIVFELL